MPPSQPWLPTIRAFVVQLRTPPPGISAAYGAKVKHLVSGHVVRCHPCGIPMACPQSGAVWYEEAVSHAGDVTGVSNPVPRRRGMETYAVTQILRLLVKVSIIGFVVGHLLALGMRLTVQEILEPLRRRRLVVLALVANFVLGPIFAYLSAQLISVVIPLEQGYVIGLMIIGSAAGSPMLPKWVKLAKGDLGFGVALMVLLMGASIFYLPLVLPRLISGVDVEPWRVAQPLIMMILVPFIVGLLLKGRYPRLAARLEPPLDRFSSACLMVVIVAVVALYWESLVGAVGEGAIAACMLFVALLMAAGYLLGGPDVGTRRVLALGSGQRNMEAVFLIASTSVADPKVMVITVIAALVVLIVLLGTAAAFGRRTEPAGHRAMPG
jgi:predicted Na+-dependent transporter